MLDGIHQSLRLFPRHLDGSCPCGLHTPGLPRCCDGMCTFSELPFVPMRSLEAGRMQRAKTSAGVGSDAIESLMDKEGQLDDILFKNAV